MIKRHALSKIVVTSVALAGLWAGQCLPALAATTKAKATPKGAISITNARSAMLVELAVISHNAKVEPAIVARSLASGTATRAALPKAGGCIYDIDGLFEDETTVQITGLNLCKDARINLVE